MRKVSKFIFAVLLSLALISSATAKQPENTAATLTPTSDSSSSSSSKLPLRYVEITLDSDFKDNATSIITFFANELTHKVVKNITLRNMTVFYVRFKTETDAATFIANVTESRGKGDNALALLVDDIRAVDVTYVHQAQNEYESSEEHKPDLDVIFGVLVAIIAFLIIGSISIDQALKESRG